MARNHSFWLVQQQIDLAGALEPVPVQASRVLGRVHPTVRVPTDSAVHLARPATMDPRAEFRHDRPKRDRTRSSVLVFLDFICRTGGHPLAGRLAPRHAVNLLRNHALNKVLYAVAALDKPGG
jgi:hypothetical protein